MPVNSGAAGATPGAVGSKHTTRTLSGSSSAPVASKPPVVPSSASRRGLDRAGKDVRKNSGSIGAYGTAMQHGTYGDEGYYYGFYVYDDIDDMDDTFWDGMDDGNVNYGGYPYAANPFLDPLCFHCNTPPLSVANQWTPPETSYSTSKSGMTPMSGGLAGGLVVAVVLMCLLCIAVPLFRRHANQSRQQQQQQGAQQEAEQGTGAAAAATSLAGGQQGTASTATQGSAKKKHGLSSATMDRFGTFKYMAPAVPDKSHLEKERLFSLASATVQQVVPDDEDIESGSSAVTSSCQVQHPPPSHVQHPTGGEGEDFHVCQICLEDWQDGDHMLVLPCTHIFHKACAQAWLQDSATCPVCRSDMAVYSERGVEMTPVARAPCGGS